MTTNLNTRNASEKDIPLIRQLSKQVWPQTYLPILSVEQVDYMFALMYSEEALQQQMDNGHEFLLLYDGEEPVGFASYGEASPGNFKLHKLYVLPLLHKKGTGTFLINAIMQRAKSGGGKSLQLNVNRYNTAKSFYEKKGFEVIREEDIDIGDGYLMNDYVMEIVL